MAADTNLAILTGVARGQRRSLTLWAVALGAVSALYLSFWPSMGGDQMTDMINQLPEALVKGMGYDRIGTPGGWITSTVYGLLGPALLLVFAIGTAARLIAGSEEDGTLELEFTAPVSRRRVYLERLGVLVLDIVLLVATVMAVTQVLVFALDMDVPTTHLLAGSLGLLLLILGIGALTLAIGAATGRRGWALGVGAAVAVVAYMLNAIGPAADIAWMSSVSPFGWYLEGEPLINGFDWGGLAKLAAVPLVVAPLGLLRFERRDLMV